MVENPHNPTPEEIYESDLHTELRKWEALGIEPKHWLPSEGILGIVLRLDVLNDILIEAGIVDLDNANEKMRQNTLTRLKAIREDLEPSIQQARLDMIRNGRLRRR